MAALAPRFVAGLLAGSLAVWSMTAIYACAMILLHQREGWAQRLRPLAAVGRMTLTTYLSQSVVCTLLFYRYGVGWFGRRGYTDMFVIACLLFASQMIASTWWLARYRFGPVEWAWRSLTYWRRQPMRLPSRAPA